MWSVMVNILYIITYIITLKLIYYYFPFEFIGVVFLYMLRISNRQQVDRIKKTTYHWLGNCSALCLEVNFFHL